MRFTTSSGVTLHTLQFVGIQGFRHRKTPATGFPPAPLPGLLASRVPSANAVCDRVSKRRGRNALLELPGTPTYSSSMSQLLPAANVPAIAGL